MQILCTEQDDLGITAAFRGRRRSKDKRDREKRREKKASELPEKWRAFNTTCVIFVIKKRKKLQMKI